MRPEIQAIGDGMNKQFKKIAIYQYIYFFLIYRLVLSTLILFIGIWSPVVLASIYCGLSVIYLFQLIISPLFLSYTRKPILILMQLLVVAFSIMTIVEESTRRLSGLGKALCISFISICVIVFLLIFIEIVLAVI